MLICGRRGVMTEYVFSIVLFSIASGIVLILVPEGTRQGLKKHLKLITSLCLICILISPMAKLMETISSFDGGDINGIFGTDTEGELYDKYNEIYQNYLDGGYGENIGEAVKEALYKRFGIAKENARVLTEFSDKNGDGVREPRKITIVLSGSAIVKEPDSIKKFVSEVFECDTAVAIE
jgi:hypothetical protein